MNKTQLVDALAERLGDRRTAASAVDGLIETIVDTVRAGDSVSLTGFGVFEGRARAARTARNPRTGEAVDVPAATVPAFRPGATFRSAVGGAGAPAPRSRPARSRAAAVTTEPEAAPAKPARRKAKATSSFSAEKPSRKPAAKNSKAKSVKEDKSAKESDKAKKPKSKK